MPTDPSVVGDVLDRPAPVAKEPEPNVEPPLTPEPNPEPTPEPNPEPEPTPAPTPLQLTAEQWEAHQAEVRELKTWRTEQERIRAEQIQRENATPVNKEWTPEQWGNIEKEFGFSVSVQKGMEGAPDTEVLHIDRKQMVQGILKAISRGLEAQDAAFDKKLNSHTSAARMETTIFDLEHRKEGTLTDIRQHLPKMREYLAKRIDPKYHADPEVLEDAYRWAKGWASPSIAANAAANVRQNRSVIHPGAPRPPAKPGSGVIGPMERAAMAGVPG